MAAWTSGWASCGVRAYTAFQLVEPAWNNGADGDGVLRHIPAMDREEVISTLKDREVARRARGDQRADSDSDIDILVEIEPNAGVDLFAYLDIVHFIEDLFTTRVDVANRRRLKSFVRPGPSAMRSMLSDLARSGLIDIRDNIGLAKVFVASMAFVAFKASPLNFYAVTRALKIISEANRRLRAYHPHLPWRAIRDVGNLCRHSYDDVAEDYAWATVRDHPEPPLSAASPDSDMAANDGTGMFGPAATAFTVD